VNIRELALPFRVGTTSYIIEDDLVPNASYLAQRVQEMQLVLFDLPAGPSNLPDPQTVDALRTIGTECDLTYTVHLIEDLRLNNVDGTPSTSPARARQVIEMTQPLRPWAYVLHLDGKEHRQAEATRSAKDALIAWRSETANALFIVAEAAGNPALLAVENLESYTPDFVTPVIDHLPVSRCVDIGHLWLDGHDPIPHLRSALLRTRVVHIHGVQVIDDRKRDHQSLAHMRADQIDPVIEFLIETRYGGVLSLEVFGQDDFESSMTALTESVHRCREASTRRRK
jgi:sugar phosphate isomerase/epimerase